MDINKSSIPKNAKVMASNNPKRTIVLLHDIQFVKGRSINYIEMRDKVLDLLKSKELNKEDIYKISVFLNFSAFNSAKPKVVTTKGTFTLEELSQFLAINKEDINATFDKITIARISRCLAPECLTNISNWEDEEVKYVAPFFDEKLGYYCFFNAYVLLPVEKRELFFLAILDFEKRWKLQNKQNKNSDGLYDRFSNNVRNFYNVNAKPQLAMDMAITK